MDLTSEQTQERMRWADDNVRQLVLERQTSLDRLFGIEHHAKVERTRTAFPAWCRESHTLRARFTGIIRASKMLTSR